MFSWVELLLARTLTSVDAKPIAATMTRTVSAAGMDWGVLAAAGVLTIVPGAIVIWFVRNYIAKGFALAARGCAMETLLRPGVDGMDAADGRSSSPASPCSLAAIPCGDSCRRRSTRRGFLPMPTTRGDRLFIGLLGSAYHPPRLASASPT